MHTPRRNWLLANLPRADYERLAPHLELVGLPTGTQLFPQGEVRTNFFFPTTCSISAQIELENGEMTDIYLMGDRGLFGTGTAHRGTFFRAVVRKSGFAYRCPTDIFMQELMRGEGVMMIALMGMRTMMEQMAVTIACRNFHSITQQVSRWLINFGMGEAMERMDITHAELANALGARRERVTIILNELARQECIELNRGHIKILDYSKLQQLACNCNAEYSLQKNWSEQELEAIASLPARMKTTR